MYYTPSHLWVRLSENEATIGLTQYAQKELGEIVFVELPRKGYLIKNEEVAVILESTKSAVDICSPLSGEITQVNHSLLESPHLINTSPLVEGWLFKMKPSSFEKGLSHLMEEAKYLSLIKG